VNPLKKLLAAIFLLGSCAPASALDLSFDGYADFRSFVPSEQRSWLDGGLGKTRFGSEYGSPGVSGELIGGINLQISPELLATAVARASPKQKTIVNFLESYLRYRPVSTSAFRWSLKLGALFPPISLENTDVGWSSPWTLTPSAINSWVGDELRTIGSEIDVEWRTDARALSLMGSVFGWNDPAGVLIADRGWAFDDQPTGFTDNPRLPDAYAITRHRPIPLRTPMFTEIDNAPGWYAGASWDETGIGRVQLLRYDNQADPTAIRNKQVAWDTDFWSLGAQTQIDAFTFIAQGITGSTYIKPSPSFESDTYFKAAYLLAGWSMSDEWRLATRFDIFSTEEEQNGGIGPLSEHGDAITLAANYLPNDWLRLSAEFLRIDSTRGQRAVIGLAPREIENQLQFSVRFYPP
jgi:hypothetical protein